MNGPSNKVPVRWAHKSRLDNQLPKFRPTDSDYLNRQERNISDALVEGIEQIPSTMNRNIIFGNLNETTAKLELMQIFLPLIEQTAIEIFGVYVAGVRDGAKEVREDINDALKKLRSNARLRSVDDVDKAFDLLIWEPFDWSATVDPLDLFNAQPDNMAGKAYARTRATDLFSSISDDVQANIATMISEGFTAQQAFSTGRQVTGLTTQQTARRLFDILQQASPVPITGADYANQIVPHTNGLFPRWAKAVDRSMNAYANRLAEQGIDPKEIIRRTDKHGQRYGNKLRRARARMIARTESIAARNQGKLDTMLQAQQMGLVGPATVKQWVIGPTDVCEICVPMGGETMPLGMSFDWGTGGGDYPPAHPNCRCTIQMVPNIDKAPTQQGAGSLEDPFRYQFHDGATITMASGNLPIT